MSIASSTHVDPQIDVAAGPERRRFTIWAGWSGLAASAAYIATIVATNALGSVEASDGPADVVRYLEEVGDNSAQSYIYGIAGIVMSILFIPFGIAVHAKLHRVASAAFGSLAMVVGLVLLIPAYAASILEAAALAPAATDLGAGGAEALHTVQEAGAVTASIFFTAGSILTLCVAPLLWAVAGRGTGALPAWLTRTGLVVGLSGLVWFVWLYETPVVLAVMVVNLIASLVFFIALARRLVRD